MSLKNIHGKLFNILNYLKMVETMANDLNAKAAKRINIQLDEYKKLIQNDWWTYGDEIINKNLADEIVIVGCDNKLFNTYDEIETQSLEITKDGLFKPINSTTKEYVCPI